MVPPAPSKEQLEKPSQWVRVKNTHPVQNHYVYDRYMVGQIVPPGQSRELEMTVEYIKVLQAQRDPKRFNIDEKGEPVLRPMHPIVIEEISPSPSEDERQDALGRAKNAKARLAAEAG